MLLPIHRLNCVLTTLLLLLTGAAFVVSFPPSVGAESRYAWPPSAQSSGKTLADMIPPPPGFERTIAQPVSWAAWLRGLPMKPKGSPVRLYTGAAKWRQDVHAAVVDIDVGKRDLQQCADAIMRLRAEWLYASKRFNAIAFNHTNGNRMRFKNRSNTSRTAFRKYMTRVFAYAGTYSLARELKPKPVTEIAIGDVFIKGGFPGHAVLVADMAINPQTGAKKFLLLQSFMPAQDIHVLNNPAAPKAGPWYDGDITGNLVTPEWEFAADSLRTWR